MALRVRFANWAKWHMVAAYWFHWVHKATTQNKYKCKNLSHGISLCKQKNKQNKQTNRTNKSIPILSTSNILTTLNLKSPIGYANIWNDIYQDWYPVSNYEKILFKSYSFTSGNFISVLFTYILFFFKCNRILNSNAFKHFLVKK